MEIEEIKTVGVIGAGTMGCGIAQIFAEKGFVVFLFDETLEKAQKGKELIEKRILRSKNRKPSDGITLDFILPKRGTPDNLKKIDFAIEAIFENLEKKQQIFTQLDKHCREEVIFATNTSSIRIGDIAKALNYNRKQRFIGMHFMNPPHALKLLELIRGEKTSDETYALIRKMVQELERNPILNSADTPGFIVNRGLIPNIREALRMIEDGTGSPKDINDATVVGVTGAMGPLDLGELIGWDIVRNIMKTMADELSSRFTPPQILKDMVASGYLGKKTNKGIHDFVEKECI